MGLAGKPNKVCPWCRMEAFDGEECFACGYLERNGSVVLKSGEPKMAALRCSKCGAGWAAWQGRCRVCKSAAVPVEKPKEKAGKASGMPLLPPSPMQQGKTYSEAKTQPVKPIAARVVLPSGTIITPLT